VELLSPRSLSDSILTVLSDGHSATTLQLSIILRRRKATVIDAVNKLAAAGHIKRRGRRWIREDDE
jgi:predicted transcriptional regulator